MDSNQQTRAARTLRFFVIAGVLALVASPALANAGTAMAIAVGLYLVVGNFLIGIVEWIGLGLLGASKLRAAVMIPANYLSAWVGVYLVAAIPTHHFLEGSSLLTNAIPLSWMLLICLIAFGMLIELPFVAMAFRAPRDWKRVVTATIVLNLVTGAGVSLWYATNSNMSLAKLRTVPPSEVASGLDAWVYRIDDERSEIRRIRMDGRGDNAVAELPPIPEEYRRAGGQVWLLLRPGADGLLDLCVGLHASWIGTSSADDLTPEHGWDLGYGSHAYKVVVPGIASSGSLWFDLPDESTIPRYARQAADLRPEGHGGPRVEQTYSPWAPIVVNWPDGRVERFGLFNAMLGNSATAQTATVLPNDRVVFSLAAAESSGTRGVFLASLNERTIAYLAPGRAPVVVLEPND